MLGKFVQFSDPGNNAFASNEPINDLCPSEHPLPMLLASQYFPFHQVLQGTDPVPEAFAVVTFSS